MERASGAENVAFNSMVTVSMLAPIEVKDMARTVFSLLLPGKFNPGDPAEGGFIRARGILERAMRYNVQREAIPSLKEIARKMDEPKPEINLGYDPVVAWPQLGRQEARSR